MLAAVMRKKLNVVLVLAGIAVTGHAQWLKYPTPGTPRLPNGKPNLAAPPPHVSHGTPDLSGIGM